jgi:hypothetical protein
MSPDMAHSSNRERIARAAEEARLTEIEKAAKKAAKKAVKKPAGSGSKRVAKPVRVKIVWEVCTPTGVVLATFAYQDKAEAEAKVAALTKSTGRTHALRGTKVPME